MMQNSLTLSADDVQSRIDAGKQYVVRIKIEPNEEVHGNGDGFNGLPGLVKYGSGEQ